MRPRLFALAVVVLALLAPSAPRADEPGQPAERLGTVHVPVSCTAAAQQKFDRAVALLHSFFYPETVKAFTAVVEEDPACAMGYWGIAMSHRINPLIGPLDARSLQGGWEAVQKATAIGARTARERDYVAAMEAYYQGLERVDHATRARAYERAMAELSRRYPDDTEAAIFYALALNEAADPADTTYARQIEAGRILEGIFERQPDHPGVAHYIIHTYDYAPLATRGLPAARRYAAIAPSSPHALHMPSHVFSMVGYWQDSIRSNIASAAASQAYAAKAMPGSIIWMHQWDFMTYAYLQGAQDREAARLLAERNRIEKLTPDRLTSYTAFVAIPVRYALERGQWSEAARLEPVPSAYPYVSAVARFARALGAARSGDPTRAAEDLQQIESARARLVEAGDAYWAEQIEIFHRAAAAWIAHAEDRNDAAVASLLSAADLEDASVKHIAMENRLVPMRELLGELLLELNAPAAALQEFEASLERAPNRFRSFYGAAKAAERLGDADIARSFYEKLVALCAHADTERPELEEARNFLATPRG